MSDLSGRTSRGWVAKVKEGDTREIFDVLAPEHARLHANETRGNWRVTYRSQIVGTRSWTQKGHGYAIREIIRCAWVKGHLAFEGAAESELPAEVRARLGEIPDHLLDDRWLREESQSQVVV